jgi:hypothetical protein
MKFFLKFSLIPFLFTFCECKNYTKLFSPSNYNQGTVQAMIDVIELFFIQQNITNFDFVILNSFENQTLNTINDVRARLSTHTTQVRFLVSEVYNQPLQLNNSAVIFYRYKPSIFASPYPYALETIKAIDIRIITYINGSKDYLLLCEKRRGKFASREYVLWETGKNIQLMSMEISANGKCILIFNPNKDYKKLNSFSSESMMWEKSLTYVQKNQYLDHCKLIFRSMLLRSTIPKKHPNEREQMEELFGELLNILSKKRHFEPVLTNAFFQYINRKIRKQIGEKLDLVLLEHLNFDKLLPLNNFAETYSFSLPVSNDEIFLIVTPGETYTNYEKLLLPFDTQTWQFVSIVFGVAFLVIFAMKLMPKKFQDLVYGETVKTPAYNVLGKFQITCLWQIFKVNLNFQEHSLESVKCGYHPVILEELY